MNKPTYIPAARNRRPRAIALAASQDRRLPLMASLMLFGIACCMAALLG